MVCSLCMKEMNEFGFSDQQLRNAINTLTFLTASSLSILTAHCIAIML